MTSVKRFALNTHGRDFVVGDIHGAFDLVLDAMGRVGFDPQVDRLFSVGDLIDRGPESHRCAKFLSQPYVHAVMGNHERMLLELYEDGPPSETALAFAARTHGMGWWILLDDEKRQEILATIGRLPFAIEIETSIGTVGLIHADVPIGMSWPIFIDALESGDDLVVETCIWSRTRVMHEYRKGVEGIDRIFVGHTPHPEGLEFYGNIVAIDTGAVFGLLKGVEKGCLTLAEVAASNEVLMTPNRVSGLVDIRGRCHQLVARQN